MPAGKVLADQLVPPSELVTTAPPADQSEPAASQATFDAQDTPVNMLTPTGSGSEVHEDPAVDVVSTAAPLGVHPTATQEVVEPHEIPDSSSRPGARPAPVHVAPSSAVEMTWLPCGPSKAARQEVADGHETLLTLVAASGAVRAIQVDPPSVVVTTIVVWER